VLGHGSPGRFRSLSLLPSGPTCCWTFRPPLRAGKAALRRRLGRRGGGAGWAVRWCLREPVGGNDELVFDGASFVMDWSRPGSAAKCLWPLPPHGLWSLQSQGRSQWFGCGAAGTDGGRAAEQHVPGAGVGVRRLRPKCACEGRPCWGLSGGIDSALVRRDRGGGAGRGHVEALLLPPLTARGLPLRCHRPWSSGSASGYSDRGREPA